MYNACVCPGMVRFHQSISCDTGLSSATEITDHRSIESRSADQTSLNPRFLLLLPFTCTHHAASSTSDQCHVSIYLLRATGPIHLTSVDPHLPLWDIIWKVNSFSSFLVSDLQVRSVCLMAPVTVHCSEFDDTRTVLEDIVKNC